MLHDSTQRLILKLCEMTDRSEIAWRECASSGSDVSVYDTEGYAVEVKSEPPGLRILRADGREVERVDAGDLENSPWPLGDGTFAKHVKAMALRAHRVARGAETAIATILSALAAPARITSPALITATSIEPKSIAAVSMAAPNAESVPGKTAAAQETLPNAIVDPPRMPSKPVRVLSLTRSQPVARFGPSFGAISSFTLTPTARQHPAQHSPPPTRSPQSAKAEPLRGNAMAAGLAMTGIHVVTRHTPAPQSIALPQAAKPAPASADVYKPWV